MKTSVKARRVLAASAVSAAMVAGTLAAGTSAEAFTPGPNKGWQGASIDAAVASGSVTAAPSAPKTEHKTWYAGGLWWAAMKNPVGAGTTIHKLVNRDTATPSWANTGVLIDSRANASADALYNSGSNQLFVSSHAVSATNNSGATVDATKISRYTLVNGTWVLDAGWPKTLTAQASHPTNGFSIALEKDGTLLGAFAYSNRVYTVTSVGDARAATVAFGAPFLVQWSGTGHNLQGVDLTLATTVSSDDVAAITSAGSYTTIMWSNQSAAYPGFFVARHLISDTYGSGNFYGSRALATADAFTQDNHISLVTDAATGAVYAAVKTSADHKVPVVDGDAQLQIIKLTPKTGTLALTADNPGYVTATTSTFTTVGEGGTRPQLVLDNSARVLRVYYSAPNNGRNASKGNKVSGVVFTKTASLADGSSTPGQGEPVLYHNCAPAVACDGSDTTGPDFADGINDASVTASPITNATGLAIIGTSSVLTNTPTSTTTSRTYWFNDILRLPTATFTTAAISADLTNVQFTDTSTGRPTSWAWSADDGWTSTAQNPSHPFAIGTHSVSLTVTNDAGTSATTTVQVTAGQAPVAAGTSSRAGISAAVLGARFFDQSTGFPSLIRYLYGDGTASAWVAPGTPAVHVYKVAGLKNVILQAQNALGTTQVTIPTYVSATPIAPVALAAKAYKGRKALVGWTAANPRGRALTKYQVFVVSKGLRTRVITVKPRVRAIYVTGLIAGRKYTFLVRAFNAWGVSLLTPHLAGRTKAAKLAYARAIVRATVIAKR